MLEKEFRNLVLKMIYDTREHSNEQKNEFSEFKSRMRKNVYAKFSEEIQILNFLNLGKGIVSK